MRRTEARQGVRMIKFRSVFDRYEATNSTRSKRPNCSASPSGRSAAGASGLKTTARPGCLDRRLGRSRPSGFRANARRRSRRCTARATAASRAKHFHEHLVRDHQFTWGYTWTKVFLQSKGLLVTREDARRAPAQAAAPSAARDDAASGRLAA